MRVIMITIVRLLMRKTRTIVIIKELVTITLVPVIMMTYRRNGIKTKSRQT